jgi:hypothetical protein
MQIKYLLTSSGTPQKKIESIKPAALLHCCPAVGRDLFMVFISTRVPG